MLHRHELRLTPTSTLADLPLHDFRVHGETPALEVAAALERWADLPGVVVTLEGGGATLISRRTFFQHMSRGFGRELYLRRPVRVLVCAIAYDVLCLPADCGIPEAADAALRRPQELAYEPALVTAADRPPRLLDAYDLLLGQAELLALANQTIQQQKEAAEAANRALREAQAAVVQSEKLASLGHLAAGLAHEINNPVTFVSNNQVVLQREVQGLLQLVAAYAAARDDPGRAAEAERLAEEIDLPYIEQNVERQFRSSLDGLRRVRDIVRQLSDFARLDRAAPEEVDLHAGLRSTVALLQSEVKRKALRLETEFDGDAFVHGYAGKLNQVFLNLLMNAIHACGPGGVIRVRTRAVAGGVCVEVEDNGTGIRPEHLPRLFEPFFTTKPVGQGTGLGLAVSYGIVRDHGGSISVESTPGCGSVFRVRLPTRAAPAPPEEVRPALA
jgi:signal transduction histidine kinase